MIYGREIQREMKESNEGLEREVFQSKDFVLLAIREKGVVVSMEGSLWCPATLLYLNG